MTKFEGVVAAIKQFDVGDEEAKSAARAVLISLRDPRDIPPSQLGAWQANIDSILKDAK